MNLVFYFAVFFCLITAPAISAQSQSSAQNQPANDLVNESGALPDLVVRRQNNLENIIYEADDSISLTKLDIETVQRALASGDGVAINFDLEFASKTAVMTAEGKHVVDTLLGAMKYVRTPMLYELEVRDTGGKRALSESRAQALLSRLKSRFSQHQFSLSKSTSISTSQRPYSSSPTIDVWSFSVVSMALPESSQ